MQNRQGIAESFTPVSDEKPAARSSPTERLRLRLRFRKEDDLRLISHRDLARTFERLFRRAGIRLAMSQGYHPKAKLSFPSALSLGIRGLDELVEVELAESLSANEVVERLNTDAPAGLLIESARMLQPGEKKAQLERFCYEIVVPPGREPPARTSMENLLAQSSFLIERDGRDKPVDLRAGLDHAELSDGVLRFSVFAPPAHSVRPREVLKVLGLEDLEDEGCYLTRTAVQISSPIEQSGITHEEGNVD